VERESGHRSYGVIIFILKTEVKPANFDIARFIGASENSAMCYKFKGVETTGLTAAELHSTDPKIVKQKMKDATKRLVKGGNCSVICLGCAGMAGMDEIVREAVVEELGNQEAEFIRIIDGVTAGIVFLEGVIRILPDRRKARVLMKPQKHENSS